MKRAMHVLAVLAIIAGFVYFGKVSVSSQNTSNYTCNPDGSYLVPSTGPAALTASDITYAASAEAWLRSMAGTNTDVVTSSTIGLSQNYAPGHTGEITGSFNLQDRIYPVDDVKVITNVSPGVIPNSYTGVVSGRVTMTPTAFRWIIQLYKRDVSNTISQVPVQVLADASTGDFTINLPGGYDNNSEWLLGVLDANNSYVPYGPHWPAPTEYDGLEVQHLIVTDSVYYWSTVPARVDGDFTFTGSNTGNKIVRLAETATDEILAEYVKPTGLVRSYRYAPGETGYGTGMEERSFVYDQALALFASLSYGDSAHAPLLADGLLQLQTSSGQHDGGFVFAAPQMSPSYTDPLYRTGAHAIATDALLAFIETYRSEFTMSTYEAAADRALAFVDDTLALTGDKQGLYLGGYGNYSGNPQVFDPAFVIPWASTEHNIDAWHMYHRAARVLNEPQQQTKADNLKNAVLDKLYNTAENRLNQGYAASGQDLADPLDVNSWGAIMLYANNELPKARLALERVDLFENTLSGVTGYAPFYSSGGYPGATPTVWFEGSFGVVLAHLRLGDFTSYRNALNNLTPGQELDGSFRYATDEDSTYEIGTSRSVAGTAWFILATTGRDLLWNTCKYVEQPLDPVPDSTPSTEPVKPVKTKKKAVAVSVNNQDIVAVEEEDTVEVVPKAPVMTRNPVSIDSPVLEQEESEGSSKSVVLAVAAVGVAGAIVAAAIAFYRKYLYRPEL